MMSSEYINIPWPCTRFLAFYEHFLSVRTQRLIKISDSNLDKVVVLHSTIDPSLVISIQPAAAVPNG